MTLVMGIVNVTPDSFSDGGRFLDVDAAVEHAVALRDAGADLVDVGGESTRPGAESVPIDEEQRRALPVVEALVREGIGVSIDTRNAATARRAVELGARVVNDISGGAHDPDMPRLVSESEVTFVAMHSRGSADAPADYRDVVAEVRAELTARLAALIVAGVDPARVVLDPGIGFAKSAAHNWALLRGLPNLAGLGQRLLVGASRKRFLADLLPADASAEDRDAPTAIVSALAAQAGVWAVRVHDVAGTRRALDVVDAWRGAGGGDA